jgi:hypothetical protein
MGIIGMPRHLPVSKPNRFITDLKGKIIGSRPESEDIVFEAPPLITKLRWDELQKRLESSNSLNGRPSS